MLKVWVEIAKLIDYELIIVGVICLNKFKLQIIEYLVSIIKRP